MEAKRRRKQRPGAVVSPPPPRLRHPLEENIFTSLLITVVAVFISVIGGVPLLLLTGALLCLALTVRYSLLTIQSLGGAIAFLCTNRIRNTPADRTPPALIPRNR